MTAIPNGFHSFEVDEQCISTTKSVINGIGINNYSGQVTLSRFYSWLLNSLDEIDFYKRYTVSNLKIFLNSEEIYKEDVLKSSNGEFIFFICNLNDSSCDYGGQVEITHKDKNIKDKFIFKPKGNMAFLIDDEHEFDQSPINVSSDNYYLVRVKVIMKD